jgi:hypothetical protein
MDKSDLTFMILLSFKTQLGFAGRDYMYYKKQHGRDVAYLKPLEYTKDGITCTIRNNMAGM